MLDPSDMSWQTRLAFFCALAFGGAISSLTVWPPKTRLTAVCNLFVGTLLSIVTTPAIVDILAFMVPSFESSDAVKGAVYFWLGALGLKLIPLMLAVAQLLKSIKIGGNA